MEPDLQPYFDKWIRIANRTHKAESGRTKEALRFMYGKILNCDPPAIVTIHDSPLDCQMALLRVRSKSLPFAERLSEFYSQVETVLSPYLAIDQYTRVYGELYRQFQHALNQAGTDLEELSLRKTLSNLNQSYFSPSWTHLSFTELSRHAYFEYLLKEVCHEQNEICDQFAEWSVHLGEIHQCWLFRGQAVVCNFPIGNKKSPEPYLGFRAGCFKQT